MSRITLALAALAVAAVVSAPAAEAAPPYCVSVTDSGGTLADSCAITPGCVVEGTVLPATVLGFAYCVTWP
jgi:hypothetical protein